MRLFIAIELSEEIRAALAQIQSHLKYSGADVKWIEKDNIHLTLKFLGDVSDEKAEKIKQILDDIVKETKSFELSLKMSKEAPGTLIGAFPNINYPRGIWVGLDKGAAKSKILAEKIDDTLSKIGFQKETRPFAAHLTIGRVRSPKNKEALKEKMTSYQLSAISLQLVKSVALFQSTLTPKGAVYTKLHESKLG